MAQACFVITPIGEEGTSIRRQIDGLMNEVLRPLLMEHGFDSVVAAHEISDMGSISNQIITRICEDALVIANLTHNNPNVMYELAIRHAIKKPVIHICEKETNLPFDIRGERTIFFQDDIQGVLELKKELKKALQCIDLSKEYDDNPIHSSIKINLFNKVKESDIEHVYRIIEEMNRLYVIKRLDEIEQVIK